MSQQRLPRDVVAYNATISACSKSSWLAALGLFAEMRCFGIEADTTTYNSTISACARGQQWHIAMLVLETMRSSSIRMDTITYSSLIGACTGQQWRCTVDLLTEMRRCRLVANNVTYSAAIGVFGKANQWEHAMRLFFDMGVAGVQADRITCNALITACEKGKQWTLALWLFEEMRRSKLVADVITYSSLISACEKGKHWTGALHLLRESQRSSIQADTVTFNASISACEKQKQWETALDLFEEMRVLGIAADTVTYNATISALEKGGQWERALQMLQLMEDAEVERNCITFSAAISACEKGKRWASAVNLLCVMKEAGVQGNTIAYYAAMSACEACHQWDVASVLLQEMLDGSVEDVTRVRVPYVHRYQAGSSLDCFKHVVLATLLRQMTSDPAPFTYVDTHAGGGIYDFASPEALLLRRFEGGILRLQARAAEHSHVAGPIEEYLATLRKCNELLHGSDSDSDLRYYLGSPALAQQWLRPQDKAVLFEKAAAVHAELRHSLGLLDPQTGFTALEVHNVDSYRWLTQKSATGPAFFEGRGLVLIDPPYDSYDSYTAWNLFVLKHLRERWPSSSIALWYPCRDAREHSSFLNRVRSLQLGDVLVAEMSVAASSEALESSGMLLVNPPPDMEPQLASVLPNLAGMLSPPPGTCVTTSLQWLSE
ncbi:unnamed protein product [Polarella glacialis]|uniref:Uncharacterized protein n=1 Tax=Polarella glacialis TaxID=89957 RepID=A0A813IU35_POLGL|nr:unnamed protein product [Polarella glacialis]